VLSRDPEAQKAREELRQIVALMEGTEQVNPPPTLKAGVMQKIEGDRGAVQEGRSAVVRLREVFAPLRDWRLIYTFAGGILVGALLYGVGSGVFTRSDVYREEAVGTLGTPREVGQPQLVDWRSPANENAPEGFTSLVDDGFDSASVHGYVRAAACVRPSTNDVFYRLHCELVAPDSLTAVFTFDENKVRVMAITPHAVSSNTIQSSPGQIRIQARRIEGLALGFHAARDQGASIHVSIRRAGVQAYGKDFVVQ
jgi:hypothetical protein